MGSKTNERIKNILSLVMDVPLNDIDDNSSSDNISNWDSLKHINLVLALEDEFEIQFSEEQIPLLISYVAIKDAILAYGS